MGIRELSAREISWKLVAEWISHYHKLFKDKFRIKRNFVIIPQFVLYPSFLGASW